LPRPRARSHLSGDGGRTQAALKDKDWAGWPTVRRFLPYLWPKERPDCAGGSPGGVFVVSPRRRAHAAVRLRGRGRRDVEGGDQALWVALGLVIAYAGGRFATVLFDNVRNIVFERVGQDAVRALTEDVFARLHRLSLRFHLRAAPARSPRSSSAAPSRSTR
jgi:ATP-binding cassette subfamily B protein